MKNANVVTAACNAVEFLRFFDEASRTVDPFTYLSVLDVDEIVVIDNFAAHHRDCYKLFGNWAPNNLPSREQIRAVKRLE